MAMANMPQAGRALFLEEVQDRFGVAPRAELMPALDEAAAQRFVIEDLAVEDDPQRLVFVGDRLVAAGHIDDRQAAHPEPHLPVRVVAGIVGTATGQAVGHPSHQ
jgi:hypothetical protein